MSAKKGRFAMVHERRNERGSVHVDSAVRQMQEYYIERTTTSTTHLRTGAARILCDCRSNFVIQESAASLQDAACFCG
jgi:hypothetical protein